MSNHHILDQIFDGETKTNKFENRRTNFENDQNKSIKCNYT